MVNLRPITWWQKLSSSKASGENSTINPPPEFMLQRNILFQIYSEENTLTPAQHLQTSAGPKVNTAFTKELKVNSNQRTKKK